ncbi:MAG: 50S ribosomal protein L25 [Bacteroidota bacterium]
MKEVALPVEIRTQLKKKVGSLRRAGFIPGVYYLHGESNISLKVKLTHLLPLVTTNETHIINLNFTPGETRQGIIREVQFDAITDKPVHIDFQGVRADEELTLKVPIVLTGGIPSGVREGGVLQHILHSLEISCLPKFIPEHIEINIANLSMNHTIHVSDLNLENLRILTHAGDPIVSVLPPLVEKVQTPEEAAADAAKEPEVITKGKKEEEGAPATGDKGAKAATPKK